MSKLIYLAGSMEAYSGTDKARAWREEAKKYFDEYSEYFECISHVDFYDFGSDNSQNNHEVMRFDLRKVRESDIVLVNCNDLRKSIGTCDEIFYAYMTGKPIIGFLDDNTDQNTARNLIHPWKYEQLDRLELGEGSMYKAMDYIRNYYYM